MRFEVLGKPQGKARPRFARKGKFVTTYTPDKTVTYENCIIIAYNSAVKQQVECLYENTLTMRIIAIYEPPKSFSKIKKRKAVNGDMRPTTKPDLDNIAKVVGDALNGIAYKDDSQIVHLSISKIYGNEAKLIIEIKENEYE